MFSTRTVTSKNLKNVREMSSFIDKILGKTSTKFGLEGIPPGVILPKHHTAPKVTTKVGTLENGMKVITESSRIPVSTIGLTTNVGSRYEDSSVQGITNFMERMILKSTRNRPTFRLVRDMAKLGVDINAVSTRENLTITAQTASSINPVLGAIADLVKAPEFNFHELNQEYKAYKADMEKRAESYDVIVNDAIHAVAFGKTGLGASMYATKHTLENFDTQTMHAWHNMFFTPNNMTLVATGVEHDSFVELANEMFTKLPKNKDLVEKVKPVYVGGDVRIMDPNYDGLTHVSLGFNAPSWKCDDVYAGAVLQMILGGGGSFSSGGPGKGLYSRLYQNVLKHSWVETATSFHSIYSDAGLFGLYATAPAEGAGALVDILAAELKGTVSVSAEEVSRAKNLLKRSVVAYLEADMSRVEEIGNFYNMFGTYNPHEILAKIDAVSVDDVVKVTQKIQSSPLSLVTYGDASTVPRTIKL